MNKKRIELVINDMLSTGADFAEIFIEDKKVKTFNYIDQMLESYQLNQSCGAGLRIAKEDSVYYASTNDFSKKNINEVVKNLKNNIDDKVIYKDVKLKKLKKYKKDNNSHYSDDEIKELLSKLDKKIRNKDKRIDQVNLAVVNEIQNVTIANYSGLYVSEDRIHTRLVIVLNLLDQDKSARIVFSKTSGMNLDFLDEIDFDKEIETLVKSGIDKLYAKPCIGKVMPVVISNGFCGTIFHEACGHAMEATSVADGLSVLSDDLNKKIASDKVTIIDDGTINNEWGSAKIDDEGHETRKNVLIENGYLKGFLIDEVNSRKMKMNYTGSARRESYEYAPTSRMNNTYLAKGTDKIEDMIKSIDLGLFVSNVGGGIVSTETGDFNFGCDLAYMIRDGKIAECVKSASLIGNTKEILKEVEMVSDDLTLAGGNCGSVSGWVPVNVGEPTIKIGHIMVGGENEE